MYIDSEYSNLIKNIKYFRKRKKITQEQLAELADLSVSYIKQIESGKEYKNITFSSLSKITNALDIELDKLFDKIILK